MIRTQIYLPEETHTRLIQLAEEKETTLSRLIREGADDIIKKHRRGLTSQEKALRFFANPPKKFRLNITSSKLIEMIRKGRDE